MSRYLGLKVKVFSICFGLFLVHFANAQNPVEWATKMLLKSDKFASQINYPELILGPPSIYPNYDYNSNLQDQYADGYILFGDDGGKEEIHVGFRKEIPANQLIVGGIFNDATIKRIFIIGKEDKETLVYTSPTSKSIQKQSSINVFFKLMTVYGVKIQIDRDKINNWNILKGIGIVKSTDTLQIQPLIYQQAAFPRPKDTIGHNINTSECYEFNPRLSPDASKLYFVKECPGTNDQDIWVSEHDENGKWKPARSMGKPLNNESFNFVASVSLDGNTLLVGNTYKEDGSVGGPGVSISKRKDDGTWSVPSTVNIPKLMNNNTNANYYMSMDAMYMLIAMEDGKSEGDLDLYVSQFNKYSKKWEEPMNLGPAINSPFAEDYPYLAPDGVTLYYSSKGNLGYGGHDIYVTTRLDNSWKKWSQPHNLGSVINSKADDKGFIIANSGDMAYYNTVSFDSVHNMDIYRIEIPKALRQRPQVLIKGRIFNSKTKKAVKTVIKFKDADNKRNEYTTISNDNDGNFAFVLPFGKSYEVIVEVPNYFKVVDKIDLFDTTQKSKFLKDYAIDQYLDSGEVTLLQNILFEFGTANLKDSVVADLDKMVAKLKQQSKSIVEVGGHTDDRGGDDLNLKLSDDRALSVKNYLMSKGIRDWRLKTRGYGETAPIATNETDEGRRLNRRVEIKILDDDFTKKSRLAAKPKHK